MTAISASFNAGSRPVLPLRGDASRRATVDRRAPDRPGGGQTSPCARRRSLLRRARSSSRKRASSRSPPGRVAHGRSARSDATMRAKAARASRASAWLARCARSAQGGRRVAPRAARSRRARARARRGLPGLSAAPAARGGSASGHPQRRVTEQPTRSRRSRRSGSRRPWTAPDPRDGRRRSACARRTRRASAALLVDRTRRAPGVSPRTARVRSCSSSAVASTPRELRALAPTISLQASVRKLFDVVATT